jgi:hypothetical protein
MRLDPEAVAQGVYEAFLTVLTLDGFGLDYPMNRRDLLDAVTEGVRQAFADVLQAPPAKTDD